MFVIGFADCIMLNTALLASYLNRLHGWFLIQYKLILLMSWLSWSLWEWAASSKFTIVSLLVN